MVSMPMVEGPLCSTVLRPLTARRSRFPNVVDPTLAPLRSVPLRQVKMRLVKPSSAKLRLALLRSVPLRSGSSSECFFLQAFQTSTPCLSISRCSWFAIVFHLLTPSNHAIIVARPVDTSHHPSTGESLRYTVGVLQQPML